MNSSKIIFIIGPTAVGKSDIAFHFVKKVQGEIISCDSMQVYKEINIASDKPSVEILSSVPHHLVNIISVEEEFNVARFNELALEAIKDIQGRNRIPVIVGGSGMYMKVLLDGIFEGGHKNEVLRQELWNLAEEEGDQVLYNRLKEKDMEASAKIHPNDVKKIIRALEVCQMKRGPILEVRKKRKGIWGKYDIKLFALNRERHELYTKINDRVDQMFDKGLLEEIKGLPKERLSLTAQGLIGVKEILAALSGEYDLEQARYLMKRNTRHFAKRQLTWFRKDERLTWIMINEGDAAKDIAERIYSSGN